MWSLLIPHVASGPQWCWLDEQSRGLVPGVNLWVPWLTLRAFSPANRCAPSWQAQSSRASPHAPSALTLARYLFITVSMSLA